jgi:beta-carotene ketolase (CrtW type)
MGVLIALSIIFVWLGHLFYVLNYQTIDPTSITMWFHIVFQAWISTGLFITAHDAMHSTVAPNKKLNNALGYITTFMYAGMSYKRLLKNHILHHQFPGTANDPDYNVSNQNFFVWWFRFMMRYLTIWQMLIMAVLFNVMLIWFSEWQLLLFWVAPLFLSTFQLFYFGTYLPHRTPHTEEMGKHRARSLSKNHLKAFVSCYFFGYHAEHHKLPHVAWWLLYRTK